MRCRSYRRRYAGVETLSRGGTLSARSRKISPMTDAPAADTSDFGDGLDPADLETVLRVLASLSNGLCKGVRFTPLKEKHCDYGCDQPGARGASSEAEGAC